MFFTENKKDTNKQTNKQTTTRTKRSEIETRTEIKKEWEIYLSVGINNQSNSPTTCEQIKPDHNETCQRKG